jgi:hypothetical protein
MDRTWTDQSLNFVYTVERKFLELAKTRITMPYQKYYFNANLFVSIILLFEGQHG